MYQNVYNNYAHLQISVQQQKEKLKAWKKTDSSHSDRSGDACTTIFIGSKYRLWLEHNGTHILVAILPSNILHPLYCQPSDQLLEIQTTHTHTMSPSMLTTLHTMLKLISHHAPNAHTQDHKMYSNSSSYKTYIHTYTDDNLCVYNYVRTLLIG